MPNLLAFWWLVSYIFFLSTALLCFKVWSCYTRYGVYSYLTLLQDDKLVSKEVVALRYNVLTKKSLCII